VHARGTGELRHGSISEVGSRAGLLASHMVPLADDGCIAWPLTCSAVSLGGKRPGPDCPPCVSRADFIARKVSSSCCSLWVAAWTPPGGRSKGENRGLCSVNMVPQWHKLEWLVRVLCLRIFAHVPCMYTFAHELGVCTCA